MNDNHWMWVISGVCTIGGIVLGWFGVEVSSIRAYAKQIDDKHTEALAEAQKEHAASRARMYKNVDTVKDTVHKLEVTVMREMATKTDLKEMETRLIKAIELHSDTTGD